MKIKIITVPIIDVWWLMRSPQIDIWSLYSILKKSNYWDNVSMKDFRFFFYDDYYDIYKKNLIFKKEYFYEHKNLISLLNWSIKKWDFFYDVSKSLYDSISEEFVNIDYLILPISIFEQFSLEYLLSSLIFAYFFNKSYPNSKIIFFWTYSSIYIKNIMSNFLYLDWMIRKLDKESIIKYIEFSENWTLWWKIENFTYRFKDKLIIGSEIDIDINTELIADYSGFDLSVYKQNNSKLVMSYELWCWCRNNCFYCYNLKKWWKYQIKNIQKIISELEIIKNTYNTNLINFNDDEINYSNSFLIDLSNKIIKNKLEIFWTALIIPKDLDEKLLLNLYNSWCRQLRFWIESWSQRILDIIGKKTKLEEIENILKTCKEIWISTYASFIVDLPQETNQDIILTMNFIKKNKNLLDNITICVYNSHIWNFDLRYFNYLMWEWTYDFNKSKRISRKKILIRKFCDKLWIFDIDVIDFIKNL